MDEILFFRISAGVGWLVAMVLLSIMGEWVRRIERLKAERDELKRQLDAAGRPPITLSSKFGQAVHKYRKLEESLKDRSGEVRPQP